MKQEIERLKSEADTLESKKIETLEILKYVQSSDFAEQKARMEFNMSKPGEQVAIVKSGGSGEIGNGQVDNIVVESSNVSNFIKWWNFFTAY